MCGGITIRWSGPGILRDLLSPLHDKDARFPLMDRALIAQLKAVMLQF